MTKPAAEDRWRVTAEWDAYSTVLLAWPTAESGWDPDDLPEIRSAYRALITAIRRTTPVTLCLSSGPTTGSVLETLGSGPHPVTVVRLSYRDTWVRDFGPISIRNGHQERWLDFRFQNWDGQFDGSESNPFGRLLAPALQLPKQSIASLDWSLEGGAIDSDGRGTLLLRSSYFEQKYPRLNRQQIQVKLQQDLPTERLLWLQSGELDGDHTDGHIDLLARFVDARTIAYQSSSQHSALGRMERELQQFTRVDGHRYRLIPLPTPQLRDASGAALPASYVNFLITNGQVLVPIYGVTEDEIALARLGEAFGEHQVHGIDCRALIRNGGGLHCATLSLGIAQSA